MAIATKLNDELLRYNLKALVAEVHMWPLPKHNPQVIQGV